MQIRVIRYPEEREAGCPLVSTCDEAGRSIYGLETDGRLVATFKKEDNPNRVCLAPSWNFDLPFADGFDHGQVLVKIIGNIEAPPPVKIYGIADTSMKRLIFVVMICCFRISECHRTMQGSFL